MINALCASLCDESADVSYLWTQDLECMSSEKLLGFWPTEIWKVMVASRWEAVVKTETNSLLIYGLEQPNNKENCNTYKALVKMAWQLISI